MNTRSSLVSPLVLSGRWSRIHVELKEAGEDAKKVDKMVKTELHVKWKFYNTCNIFAK